MQNKEAKSGSNESKEPVRLRRDGMRRFKHFGFYQKYARASLGKFPIKELVRVANPFLLASPRMPPMLAIELTNHCNLRCPYCVAKSERRDKGFMSQATFSRLLAQFETPGIYFVRVVGGGEPTLHPNFADFMYELASVTSFLTLTTNWLHINDQILRAVIEAPVNMIHISVDGMTKTEYEKWRVGGNFEQLIHNINRLRSAKVAAKAKLLINIRVMLHPTQRADEYDMIKFWRDYGDTAQRGHVLDYNKDNLFDTYEPQVITRRCAVPFRMLYVQWDGNVPICSYSFFQVDNPYGFQLGNINNTSLESIWNSRAIQKCRDRHWTQQPELFPMCDGCLAIV